MDRHYKFLRMPFGMMNSGATLTHAVQMLLRGMDHVVDFVGDMLVDTTREDGVSTLKELIRRLQRGNFTVRFTKCMLGARMIDFSGHLLKERAIGLQDENVEKVRSAIQE
ncbi:transposon tf2-12 polyprotein [Plakobranchus ocellatus]|uniref:Transposon tf2-12 polyprotein n=1 Tax=Plakobranchus ocellatus TaxID=259542 RepID=A0AAV3ZUW9_9GAST|nr:transposon tf2-12 polyprotein [Plakobranchus ocellatus]